MLGFRVWDVEEERFVNTNERYMVVNGQGEFGGMEYINNTLYFVTASSFTNRYIPMQSTGMFDSNNTKIYQGDIVSLEYELDPHGINYSKPNHLCNVLIEKVTTFLKFYGSMTPVVKITILGNIYEHPEFLEQITGHINGPKEDK